MTNVSFPSVTLQAIGVQPTPSIDPIRILYIGQKTTGSAADNALVTDLHLSTIPEVRALFGAGSMLSSMVLAAKQVNQVTIQDAVVLANGSTPATGSITATGTATETGSITVVIGSRQQLSINVDIISGTAQNDIAVAIDAAINDVTLLDNIVTASDTANSVTLTSKSGGTWGNEIGIEIQGSIGGVTFTTVAFTGGAGDPALTNVFDAIQERRYQLIVWPSNYPFATITGFLEPRWNVTNNILDGVAISYLTNTVPAARAILQGLNQRTLCVGVNKTVDETVYRGGSTFELNTTLSSVSAAIIGLRLTPNANIAQFIDSRTGLSDNFGGPALASLPYANTIIPTVSVTDAGRGFIQQELTEILTDGGFVIGNNRTNTQSIFGQIPTTYKTDGVGNLDQSFKFLNYVQTLSGIREYIFFAQKVDFKQTRLTDSDDLPAGRSIVNSDSIRTAIIGYYNVLADQDFMLTRDGFENEIFFRNNLAITVDFQLGRVTATMRVPIVTQLREINGSIQLVFDVTGG